MIDQLFGSKTRVKLLYLFFNNPSRPFYVREITRKIDEQINSVRRELANLLSIGIITSLSKNNRLYYEVNQSYAHYKPLSKIFTAVGDELPIPKEADSNQKRFREIGAVRLVYLLGSFVQDPSMNIDILIVGDVNRAKLQRLISDIETEEGRELNYMALTPQEFDYRRDVNDRFISDIMNAKKSIVIDELAAPVAKK
jgi:predicted nucleotidyltransferase